MNQAVHQDDGDHDRSDRFSHADSFLRSTRRSCSQSQLTVFYPLSAEANDLNRPR
jgi:hypothetical protein